VQFLSPKENLMAKFPTTRYGEAMPTPAQARRSIEKAVRAAHPDVKREIRIEWIERMSPWIPYACPLRDSGSHFRMQFFRITAPGYATKLMHASQDSKTGKVVAT
jgi:hypothetical protein